MGVCGCGWVWVLYVYVLGNIPQCRDYMFVLWLHVCGCGYHVCGCGYHVCVLQGMHLNVGAFCGTYIVHLYMRICIKRV